MAIAGKSLRGSFDRANQQAAIQMVSAWASANELVLGQLATEVKGNEITAIPQLLKLLDIAGATVTIDAMGCQKDIADQIVEQGGDYVPAVKDNQPTLHEEVRLLLDDTIATPRRDVPLYFHQEVDGDHGRIETRRAWVTPAVDWYEDRGQWRGLRSFAAVECEREVNGKTTIERRYFIGSLDGRDPAAIAKAVRNHWHIENKLHWLLDMGFREDACRIRKGHGAENFSRLRRMALILLQREKSVSIWGWAAPGEEVTVKFNGTVTVSMQNNKYASGPFSLQFANGAKGAPGGAIKWRKVQVRPL